MSFDHVQDAYNAVKDAVLGWIEKLSAVVGGAAKRIIRDPGTFLSNLGAGIVQGLSMFIGNIGENIKGAVVQWLTGSMGNAGISLPKSFDARGIIGFLLELVGLGVANIKEIARKVFGRRVVSLIEKGEAGAEKIKQIFDILVSEGPAGLFKYLAGEFERMKGKVMGEVGKALAQGLAVAGIKKVMGIIAGLATGGAGSVVTIVMTIVDVALWFVNNAAQLAEIAGTIASMAMAILQGQVGAIAGAINNLLKRMLPVVLGFLGSLIGIGGVVTKIQKIFKTIRTPATKAITSLFKGMKGLVKKLTAKVGKKSGKGTKKDKGKEKDKKGKFSPRKVKSLVFAAMGKPTRAKEPAAALAEKQAQAQSLIAKYQPKLKKGRLKININDRSAKDVEKDAAVDFAVSAGPGKRGEAKVPIDKDKENKKVVNQVVKKMSRPTKAKTAEAALTEKRAQAQSLIAKYQPKLKKGRLKINITDRSAKDVEKDAAVDFVVSAGPGKRGEAKVPIDKDLQGAKHKAIIGKALNKIDATDQGRTLKEKITKKKMVATREINAARKKIGKGLVFEIILANEATARNEGKLKWTAIIKPNTTTGKVEEDTISTSDEKLILTALEKYEETHEDAVWMLRTQITQTNTWSEYALKKSIKSLRSLQAIKNILNKADKEAYLEANVSRIVGQAATIIKKIQTRCTEITSEGITDEINNANHLQKELTKALMARGMKISKCETIDGRLSAQIRTTLKEKGLDIALDQIKTDHQAAGKIIHELIHEIQNSIKEGSANCYLGEIQAYTWQRAAGHLKTQKGKDFTDEQIDQHIHAHYPKYIIEWRSKTEEERSQLRLQFNRVSTEIAKILTQRPTRMSQITKQVKKIFKFNSGELKEAIRRQAK